LITDLANLARLTSFAGDTGFATLSARPASRSAFADW
jgi:hypothetical protein